MVVKREKATYLFKKGGYEKAALLFRRIGDDQNEKACYGKMYNDLARKVSTVKGVSKAKQFKPNL